MYGSVYKITNLVNEKVYVGQTTETPARRWIRHCHKAKKNNTGCTKLYNAIRKYGPDAFSVTVLAEASDREGLDALETFYIQKLDAVKDGYNISAIARVAVISELGKQKLREAVVGKAHCISNVVRTPEIAAKQQASMWATWDAKGYKPTPPQGLKKRRNMWELNHVLTLYDGFVYQSFAVFCALHGAKYGTVKAALLRNNVKLSSFTLLDISQVLPQVEIYFNKVK